MLQEQFQRQCFRKHSKFWKVASTKSVFCWNDETWITSQTPSNCTRNTVCTSQAKYSGTDWQRNCQFVVLGGILCQNTCSVSLVPVQLLVSTMGPVHHKCRGFWLIENRFGSCLWASCIQGPSNHTWCRRATDQWKQAR